MITAEQRSQRARRAALVRWSWGDQGRALRAEMYHRRILRVLATGDPRTLTRAQQMRIRRALSGTPFPGEL